MKVKQLEIETFKPISIVLETKEEAELLTIFLGKLSLSLIQDLIPGIDTAGKVNTLTSDMYALLKEYSKQANY